MKFRITLLLLLVASFSHGQVRLKYNLQKGETYKMIVIADQNIDQEVMGQSMNIKQKITMGVQYNVLSKDNGIYDASCKYYRVAYQSSMMGTEVDYDSETSTGEINPMAVGFAAILNKSFGLKFNELGEVQEVYGFDEMINEMIDEMGVIDESVKAMTKEQLGAQFGGDQLKKSMEQALKFFPDKKEVGLNDTWNISVGLGGYDIDIDNTYTLSDYDKKTATILVESVVKPASFSQMANGMDMEMEMSGTQTGTLIIDLETGMLIDGNLDQDLTAKATTMGMTIPMKIKSINLFKME